MKIKEIAEYVNGEISGNPETEILNVGKIETAGKNEITFISNPLYEKYFLTTGAGAVLVSKSFEIKEERKDIAVIKVQDPYLAFVSLLEVFNRDEAKDKYGVSGNCVIGNNSRLPDRIFIDDFVKIGDNCEIGEGTRILSGAVIQNGVIIGSGCTIGHNTVVHKECRIGNNVSIHSDTVIGSDGFGFAKQQDGSFKKILQTGIVVIEDDVEIGSSCTVDRATIGETRICRGVKLDNQIQIAHNVFIDEDTVIAAQVGIAGTTKIGKRCMIGGQAGIVGHITICDDVIIGAAVGVSKSITKPGMYTGYRAKPFREELKQEASIKYIEQLREEIKKLLTK
ncbi:MAG: UDP-3-O-(3-hydroxymyristoyl)glucosamine N-acyltransferase [Ignavibacteriae bacterium]|nr:UDP-3-O-(3-hydroxymyristoyl)glucosamine N-acyltransferase [Ignavibacteriota bacterium]